MGVGLDLFLAEELLLFVESLSEEGEGEPAAQHAEAADPDGSALDPERVATLEEVVIFDTASTEESEETEKADTSNRADDGATD